MDSAQTEVNTNGDTNGNHPECRKTDSKEKEKPSEAVQAEDVEMEEAIDQPTTEDAENAIIEENSKNSPIRQEKIENTPLHEENTETEPTREESAENGPISVENMESEAMSEEPMGNPPNSEENTENTPISEENMENAPISEENTENAPIREENIENAPVPEAIDQDAENNENVVLVSRLSLVENQEPITPVRNSTVRSAIRELFDENNENSGTLRRNPAIADGFSGPHWEDVEQEDSDDDNIDISIDGEVTDRRRGYVVENAPVPQEAVDRRGTSRQPMGLLWDGEKDEPNVVDNTRNTVSENSRNIANNIKKPAPSGFRSFDNLGSRGQNPVGFSGNRPQDRQNLNFAERLSRSFEVPPDPNQPALSGLQFSRGHVIEEEEYEEEDNEVQSAFSRPAASRYGQSSSSGQSSAPRSNFSWGRSASTSGSSSSSSGAGPSNRSSQSTSSWRDLPLASGAGSSSSGAGPSSSGAGSSSRGLYNGSQINGSWRDLPLASGAGSSGSQINSSWRDLPLASGAGSSSSGAGPSTSGYHNGSQSNSSWRDLPLASGAGSSSSGAGPSTSGYHNGNHDDEEDRIRPKKNKNNLTLKLGTSHFTAYQNGLSSNSSSHPEEPLGNANGMRRRNGLGSLPFIGEAQEDDPDEVAYLRSTTASYDADAALAKRMQEEEDRKWQAPVRRSPRKRNTSWSEMYDDSQPCSSAQAAQRYNGNQSTSSGPLEYDDTQPCSSAQAAARFNNNMPITSGPLEYDDTQPCSSSTVTQRDRDFAVHLSRQETSFNQTPYTYQDETRQEEEQVARMYELYHLCELTEEGKFTPAPFTVEDATVEEYISGYEQVLEGHPFPSLVRECVPVPPAPTNSPPGNYSVQFPRSVQMGMKRKHPDDSEPTGETTALQNLVRAANDISRRLLENQAVSPSLAEVKDGKFQSNFVSRCIAQKREQEEQRLQRLADQRAREDELALAERNNNNNSNNQPPRDSGGFAVPLAPGQIPSNPGAIEVSPAAQRVVLQARKRFQVRRVLESELLRHNQLQQEVDQIVDDVIEMEEENVPMEMVRKITETVRKSAEEEAKRTHEASTAMYPRPTDEPPIVGAVVPGIMWRNPQDMPALTRIPAGEMKLMPDEYIDQITKAQSSTQAVQYERVLDELEQQCEEEAKRLQDLIEVEFLTEVFMNIPMNVKVPPAIQGTCFDVFARFPFLKRPLFIQNVLISLGIPDNGGDITMNLPDEWQSINYADMMKRAVIIYMGLHIIGLMDEGCLDWVVTKQAEIRVEQDLASKITRESDAITRSDDGYSFSDATKMIQKYFQEKKEAALNREFLSINQYHSKFLRIEEKKKGILKKRQQEEAAARAALEETTRKRVRLDEDNNTLHTIHTIPLDQNDEDDDDFKEGDELEMVDDEEDEEVEDDEQEELEQEVNDLSLKNANRQRYPDHDHDPDADIDIMT